MAKHKARAEEEQAGRKGGRRLSAAEVDEKLEPQLAAEAEDNDLDFTELPPAVGFQQNSEHDAREIDDLTDRIFGSVLSRYGWERHGNRIEHVGESRPRHG